MSASLRPSLAKYEAYYTADDSPFRRHVATEAARAHLREAKRLSRLARGPEALEAAREHIAHATRWTAIIEPGAGS